MLKIRVKDLEVIALKTQVLTSTSKRKKRMV